MKLEIVPFEYLHRKPVLTILRQTGVFRDDEIEVALELIDAYLSKTDDYQLKTAVDATGKVLGYVCFGKSPMTKSTFDLYWIAVDPTHYREGIGRKLFEEACKEIEAQGGALITIETSSKPQYHNTHRFYQEIGCQLEATIMDFYAPHDHKLIFTYRL